MSVDFPISPVIFVRLSILKGIAKAPAVRLLRINTQRGTNSAFLTPKRGKYPRPFLYGSSPGVSSLQTTKKKPLVENCHKKVTKIITDKSHSFLIDQAFCKVTIGN